MNTKSCCFRLVYRLGYLSLAVQSQKTSKMRMIFVFGGVINASLQNSRYLIPAVLAIR